MHAADEEVRYSKSPEWAAAIAQDSCLVSGYSAANYLEAFAETGTLVLYVSLQPPQ